MKIRTQLRGLILAFVLLTLFGCRTARIVEQELETPNIGVLSDSTPISEETPLEDESSPMVSPETTEEIATVELPSIDKTVAVPELNLYDKNPIITGEAAGSWNILVSPAEVIFHEGLFYLFYKGQSETESGIGYATSSDGYTWEVVTQDAPLITLEDISYDQPEAIGKASIVQEADTSWTMYITVHASGSNTIRRAVAPMLTGPWTVEDETILAKDGRDAWDGQRGVVVQDVFRTESGYIMYYVGRYGFGSSIGQATSPDGITWTKYDDPATNEARFAQSDPVLSHPTDTGEQIADFWIDDPAIWSTVEGWRMIYTMTPNGLLGGNATLNYANSADGLSWQPFADNPIFASEVPYIIGVEHIHYGDTSFLYFTLVSEDYEQFDIYLATFES